MWILPRCERYLDRRCLDPDAARRYNGGGTTWEAFADSFGSAFIKLAESPRPRRRGQNNQLWGILPTPLTATPPRRRARH